jgi:MFS family permease
MASGDETVPLSEQAPPRARMALFVLGLTQSLIVIDGVPVAVALPSIGHDFGLSSTGLQWVINGYVLALAGGLALFGRCADLYGRRRLLLAGLALLTAATLLAGLAPTGGLLVLARVVQGLGAAMVLPASLALIPVLFNVPQRRDRAFASIAVFESIAWIVGALAGGILTGWLGWRYVFLVTVPFSVYAFVMARRVLPESRDETAGGRLDIAGAVTITAGITLLVFSLSRIEAAGIASVIVLGTLALGALLIGLFGLVESRAAQPLIGWPLLRGRRLRGASLGVAANTAAYSGVVFIGTLYLQEVRSLSPTATGLVFLPLAAGALASPVLARLLGRAGARRLAVIGLLVCAAALACLGGFATAGAAPVSVMLLVLLVFGVAQYAAWLALVGQATTDVEPRLYGAASGVFKTSTHVGSAIAVALFATTIEAAGGGATQDGHPYAMAYFVAALLTVTGAGTAGALLRPR